VGRKPKARVIYFLDPYAQNPQFSWDLKGFSLLAMGVLEI